MDLDRFIEEVRVYGERTGKSQQDIAEEIGIKVGYLHKVLYRVKPLTIQIIEKAAPVLGLTLQDFLIGVPAAQKSGAEEPFDQPFANIMGILGPHMTEELKAHLIGIAQANQPKVTVMDPAAGSGGFVIPPPVPRTKKAKADIVVTGKGKPKAVVEVKTTSEAGTSRAVSAIAKLAKHHAAMIRRDEEEQEELVPVKKGKGRKG